MIYEKTHQVLAEGNYVLADQRRQSMCWKPLRQRIHGRIITVSSDHKLKSGEAADICCFIAFVTVQTKFLYEEAGHGFLLPFHPARS